MKTKPFDCVKMKRDAAEKIYQQINTMTLEEELRFWNSTSDGMQKTHDELSERSEFSPLNSRVSTPTPAILNAEST